MNGIIVQVKNHRVGGVNAQTALAGTDFSYWLLDGFPCGGNVPPATPAYECPTNLTAGALGQADATGGKQNWLYVVMTGGFNQNGKLVLHDRLLHNSGFDATLTTPQNVNAGSPAPVTRHYADLSGINDVGNEIWIEIYTLIGATQTTITASYFNELGVLHTTQPAAIGGSAGAPRLPGACCRLTLAPGDRGVQSIVSVTLAGTTGTAGNFGVTIVHPLARFVLGFGAPEVQVGAIEGNIEVKSGACLFWSSMPHGTITVGTLALAPTFFCFVEK